MSDESGYQADGEFAIAGIRNEAQSIALRRPASRALISREQIDEESAQRRLLGEYVRSQMREGVDFGVIPGTSKPTLLKPGAEKLCELFRCTAKYKATRTVEDWDKPLFHYEFRCRIVYRETGQVIAEGVGSCNSREARYRWRDQNRKCPVCGKESIIKGKAEYGGGWLCWKKKDGCGAKYDEGDPVIEGQASGKVENDDVFTLTNTILKMAKKRALVDAAIALGRVSDVFTQDAEDTGEIQSPAKEPPPTVSLREVRAIRAAIRFCTSASRPTDERKVCEWKKVPDLDKLPRSELAGVLVELLDVKESK